MKIDRKRPSQIQKGGLLELEIEDLAYGGKGIARFEGFVIFVRNGVPGDRVLARVTKRQKNHAEAEVEEILKPSPDRLEPPCPVFGCCGGCTWQNLPYDIQLTHKQKQAASLLQHIAGVTPDIVRPIIPSPVEWRYRNKMDYTFGTSNAGEPILGFHVPGRFWEILETPTCLLQSEPADRIVQSIIRWVREQGLSAYNQKTRQGFLRHLLIRHSVETDSFVVLLLTHEGELPDREGLVAALKEACPGLQGFVWGLNAGLADVARQDRELWSWGNPVLTERLGKYLFRVSPLSFFQVNTHAALKLYEVVCDLLGNDSADNRLLDAYCGTGSIGIFCSERVKEVVGIEIVREAIFDARENAARNGVANCTFLAGNMSETIHLAASIPGSGFGRIVMDPPRGGMDKRALRGLLALQAPVLIYVSCNPSTLARDIVSIVEAGYHPTVMQPVDLFPQTYHIETVLRFEKNV